MWAFTAAREMAHPQPSFKRLMGGRKFRQSEDGVICEERAHRRGGSQFCRKWGTKKTSQMRDHLRWVLKVK